MEILLVRRNRSPKITIIDKNKLSKLQEFGGKLYACWNTRTRSYYAASDGSLGITGLHRFLSDCPEGMVVDHVNHNTLDNRMENLRNVTNAENMHNSRKYATNTSGHRNVYLINGKWKVQMTVNNKKINLGIFDIDDIEQAVEVARKGRLRLMSGYIERAE